MAFPGVDSEFGWIEVTVQKREPHLMMISGVATCNCLDLTRGSIFPEAKAEKLFLVSFWTQPCQSHWLESRRNPEMQETLRNPVTRVLIAV